MSNAIERVCPKTVAKPGGHYSHATAGGGLLFVAGQLPIDENGIRLNDASFEVQAKLALNNVERILVAAGSNVANLLHVRVYITDIRMWPTFNTIYAAWASETLPARAVVPVPELHYGFMIEVEAVALAGM